MTVPLYDIINIKFPEAFSLGQVTISDEGAGAFISYWDVPEVPMPDSETLLVWEAEVQTQYNNILAWQNRYANYPPQHEIIWALWYKIMDNDDTQANEVAAIIAAVNAEYPVT